MRVALLSFNAQSRDAIGNQVAEKLAFFLERGADVRIFVESDANLHPAVHGHATVIAPDPRGAAWEFIAGADLVVAEYGQYYALLGLLPLLAGGKPRVLVDYYGVTPPELWGGHNREALERGVRFRGLVWCADAALVHSRCTAGELTGACRFPTARVHQIGLPVDETRGQPGPPQKNPRAALGLQDARLLLYVGRVAPSKRLPVLVEAVARLRDVEPAVHAVIVGNHSDIYREEMRHCQECAKRLGVAERVHFLGSCSDAELADLYRAADVFVTPSRSEGFCLPVIEAMASGLPVVAARATALPETVGGAGLTFRPDDAEDLARQIRRALASASEPRPPAAMPRRVAFVSFRYGADVVGGAEASLRTMAEHLRAAGHHIEVFTTCTNAEAAWHNELPPGTTSLDGIPVHRFPLDAHDRASHLNSLAAILQHTGVVSADEEADYLRHSIHSTGLMEALGRRRDDFDAIVAGPYLFGLTHDVAVAFPEKTVVVPCFHDEPLARLACWQRAYERVAGIWYHSPEERAFAEQTLGINHPGAVDVGTCVDAAALGDKAAGRRRAGAERYVVYCGRYSEQKGLPTLLDYAQRYQRERPDHFRFVFLGRGEVPIPAAPWVADLGFITESDKRDVLAGSAALVQLSRCESLSLVALEAWAQGTAVIANTECAVMAGHIARSGGGRLVADYETFGAALDELWHDPDAGRRLGERGRAYVRAEYGAPGRFTERLESALADLATPLRDKMRRAGLARAAQFQRPAWRAQFGRVVEAVLDEAPRPAHFAVDIEPQSKQISAGAGARRLLIPVRITNRGTHALAPEGPGCTTLRARIVAGDQRWEEATTLAGVLVPGESQRLAVAVSVPPHAGAYDLELAAVCPQAAQATTAATMELRVEPCAARAAHGCASLLLDSTRSAIAEAERQQTLPDDYTDVTQGWFARWKRWLKRKLLGNFKQAYVDVLSRRQSHVNRQLVSAVQQLADCCATLDHALRSIDERLARLEAAVPPPIDVHQTSDQPAEAYR
jgi:O-antigen biosynthesis protein